MHKSIIALVGAAGIGVATLAAPAPASADCIGCAIGAGILGGVAAGAIIGGAIANSPPPPPPDIMLTAVEALSHADGNWKLMQVGSIA